MRLVHKTTYIFYVIFLMTVYAFAQKDSTKVNKLEEVVIVGDRQLAKHSIGYKVKKMNDSVMFKNNESFTSLLRFNAPIYLREYGFGGTSSASFRGTSASNTAVVWNGININSVNNGQTEFNGLSVGLFDNLTVRSGGGSIEYGSGAIGGTVHLNDNLYFSENQNWSNNLLLSYGSFDSYRLIEKFNFSSDKIAVKAGFTFNKSENDYKLLGTDFNNSNGAFENFGFNLSGAYRIADKTKLEFYTANFLGERLLSGELPNPTAANQKYKDISHRNLLNFQHQHQNFSHLLKLAFLTQEYRYFANKESDSYNFGSSKRYLTNYNFNYIINSIDAKLDSYSEYESVFGKGDQIAKKNRRQFSQSIIYSQNIGIANFNLKVRKDFNSDYDVPFTYAAGVKIHPIKQYFIRANASKNYRVPTYNDLFWPGGQGNPNLVPETSIQGEVGVGYKNNTIKIDIAAFYIDADDKIVWQPPKGEPNKPQVWRPFNLDKTQNKGIETTVNLQKKYANHSFDVVANYSFTHAKDMSTDKFLTFVPKHLANASLSYRYKKLGVYLQQLYNGKVFRLESNSTEDIMPSFYVTNIGLTYKILVKNASEISVDFKINNLFNEKYAVMPSRLMPNRNFNININYKL